ncbi:hypothetical protein DFQ28_001901 [Apophysomyces sp. BC1034]|nr:hypothetical protein DFQ28_001901 [Apophysomyces sp. BC1034]
MKAKDIIMYKKKFKKNSRNKFMMLRGDEDSENDDDDDGDNDDFASTSTRGSHSRQLAGNKRKRKQSASEKAAKRQSEKEMSMLQETFVLSLKILSPMAADLDSWLDPPPPHSKNVLTFTIPASVMEKTQVAKTMYKQVFFKKNYTFYPPNMKPSISTDKPRINDDDASKIGDLFVTMIDPRSGDKVVGSQRQEYDKHMEDQRLLSSIKNKPRTFKALHSILQETLDGLLNVFGHVDNNHGDDDERQELALLRYLLCDYHSNYVKPTYAILPNERTTFAGYIIPTFKYFSATTGLISFIWCEKSFQFYLEVNENSWKY